MEINVSVIKNCFIFSDFTEEEIEKLCKFFTRKQYSDKSIIFKEGSTGNELFVIEEGLIAITKQVKEGTDTVIARLGPGEFFGELTMFEDFKRTASARTQGKTTLLVISHNDLLDMVEKNSKMAAKLFFSLLKVLAKRIRETNQALKEAIVWGFEAMGYGD